MFHDSVAEDAGAAYVYVQQSPAGSFELDAKLVDAYSKIGSNFGRSVAVSGNVVLVGAHESYDEQLLSTRKPVQSIQLTADATIGNVFRVGFREVRDTLKGDWTSQMSRDIPSDVAATDLGEILETDLGTGEVLISRSGPDVEFGYTWSITFIDVEEDLPALVVDSSDLTGVNVSAKVDELVKMPRVYHSAVYAYTRTTDNGGWTEQASLNPRTKQSSSCFGTAVALDGAQSVIGAFNRDTFVTGSNAGAGFIYELGFLNTGFSSPTYAISEGEALSVTIYRCTSTGNTCHVGTRYVSI